MTVYRILCLWCQASPIHQTNTKLSHRLTRPTPTHKTNPMRRTPPPRPTTSSRDVAARLRRKYASEQASCLPESSQPIQQEVQGPTRAPGLSDIPASIIFSIFVLLHPRDLVNVRNACYTFKAIVEDIDGDSPNQWTYSEVRSLCRLGPFAKSYVSNWFNPNLISKHGIRLPQSLGNSALGLYRVICCYGAPRQLPGCICKPTAGTPGRIPPPPKPGDPWRWQPSSCRLCDTGPPWRKLPPSFAAAVVARFGLPIEFLALLHRGLALRFADASEEWLLAPNVRQPSLADLRSDWWLEQVTALSLGLTYLTSGPDAEIRADELPKIPLDALLADSGRVLKVLCLTAAGPWALAEALDRADWAKGARRTKECGGELMHRCVARAALQAAREAGRGDFARVVIERDGRLFNL
ncbi:hypothetical protein DFJ73DRAFT_871800 [Zopfochytrium polystomum]|nr:hypothetical protein DFJ73DRAFT_871800 [Zopfochytrium polystomum]